MADQDDVRRIALALPDVSESPERFAFAVHHGAKDKSFAWVWMERVQPDRTRVPRSDVLAVRVANNTEKDSLVAADPERFFTEPHYNGFPAVLVRLPAVDTEELRELLTDAWRCQAPKGLVRSYDDRL